MCLVYFLFSGLFGLFMVGFFGVFVWLIVVVLAVDWFYCVRLLVDCCVLGFGVVICLFGFDVVLWLSCLF